MSDSYAEKLRKRYPGVTMERADFLSDVDRLAAEVSDAPVNFETKRLLRLTLDLLKRAG